MRVTYFLAAFVAALRQELAAGEQKHGDTWLNLPRQGQEERIKLRILEYFADFEKNGLPVPWLSIAGNAMIGWIRDTYPQLWEK